MGILRALLRTNLPRESLIVKEVMKKIRSLHAFGILDFYDLVILYLYSSGYSLKKISEILGKSQNFALSRFRKIEKQLEISIGSFFHKEFIKAQILQYLVEEDLISEYDMEIYDTIMNRILEEKWNDKS